MSEEESVNSVHIETDLSPLVEEILATWNAYQDKNMHIHENQWCDALKKRVQKAMRKKYVVRSNTTNKQLLITNKLKRVLDLVSSAIKETMNATVIIKFGDQQIANDQNAEQQTCLYTCTIDFNSQDTYSIAWSKTAPVEKPKAPPRLSKTSESSPRETKKRKASETETETSSTSKKRKVSTPEPSPDQETNDPLEATTQLFRGEIDELPAKDSVLESLLKTTVVSADTHNSDHVPKPKDIDENIIHGLMSLNKLKRASAGIDPDLVVTETDVKSASIMLQLMSDQLKRSEEQKAKYKISASEMIKRYKPSDHAFQTCGEFEDKVLIPEIASFVAMTPQTTEMMDTMRINLAVSLSCVEDVMNWLLCMQKNVNENVISLGDKTGSFLKCNNCLVHCHGFVSHEMHKKGTKQIKKTQAKLEAEKTKPRPKRKGQKQVKKGRPHKTGLQKRTSVTTEPQSSITESDLALSFDDDDDE